MRISESRIDQIVDKYLQEVQTTKNKGGRSVERKDEVAKTEDSVSITAKSREFEKAKELYSLLPDVREEEVKRAQDKLQKGNAASGEEIAEKIIYQAQIET